ncbi:MAG TPA: hypothetical protein VH592_11940 [Gemmataceae bacterium]|jgi:hypothetical protein
MKTVFPSVLLLSLSLVSVGSPLRAADPPASLNKGKVLILKTEYTIEGDIERIGDRYCVRRKLGETWVPADRVLALVASLPDAYVYLRGRISLGDPDERLRLARWCRTNGLQEQALAELHAAADLRPTHAETRRLLQYWQQVSAKAPAAVPSNNATSKKTPPPQSPADPPPLEVTTESLGLFATRVQPILMNTCARCHATGHGGKFHLTQVFEDSISNRKPMERNLAAVLAQINVNQPDASPLLIKAVSDHAHTGQAPIRDRQAAPYRTMENWVKLTVADNPQLRDKGEVAATHVPPHSVEVRDSAKSPFEEQRPKAGEKTQWGTEARPNTVASSTAVSRGDKGKTSPPAAPGATPDPYDPEPFNRLLHPEVNKPESEKK